MKLASYIEKHKNITLSGTKRFSDKSGEYYLKNVLLKKNTNNKIIPLTQSQMVLNYFDKCTKINPEKKRNFQKIIKQNYLKIHLLLFH